MSENVVIKKDRTVTVPASEAKIGVQYDHNVNVITFDCPRYPDDDRSVDMSTMQIYINYMLPDKTLGSYLAENVKVDTNNPDTIHFDWKITRNVTQVKGALQALVCVKKVDAEGNELYHWNTDLIQSFRVGEGMECLETISSDYADVISQLLVNMNTVTGEFEALSADVTARTSEETLQGLVNNAASDEKLRSIVDAYMEANPVGINVDDTLAVSGDAADAKITGDRISELKSDLADYEDAMDIKLYKVSLAESGTSVGKNWNLYYDMNIPVGTKLRITLNSYSGTLFTNMQIRFYDADGNMTLYPGGIKSIGDTIIVTTNDDYTRLWLQINRSAIENGVNASVTVATDRKGVLKALTDLENTLNEKINEEISKASIVHTFYVEKDGTGDFTKLIDAIDEAEKYMDSVVYVGNGEWDIIDELGSDYVNSVSFTQRGIVLKNRIKIVFSSKSKVICDYSGDNTTIMNWLSPFNAGEHGFTLENLNIYSRNVRYSVHDERDSNDDFYINRYINCHFFNYNENGGFRQCIGGGLGKNGYIVIENCIFENPKASNNSLVSYHNTANVGGGSAKSNIEVSNCYVKGTGTLRFSWYGTSTDITIVKATGNNLGSAIQFVAETSDETSPNENVELYEWNNIIRSN